jgi:hypothetical protein
METKLSTKYKSKPKHETIYERSVRLARLRAAEFHKEQDRRPLEQRAVRKGE